MPEVVLGLQTVQMCQYNMKELSQHCLGVSALRHIWESRSMPAVQTAAVKHNLRTHGINILMFQTLWIEGGVICIIG